MDFINWGNMKSIKKGLSLVGVSALLFVMGGCGGGTNNDQGVSFTFLGYSAPDVNGDQLLDCAAGQPLASGAIAPLSDGGSESQGDTQFVAANAQLQNNLTSQFIRLERVFLTFYIPGASAQPPSTTAAVGKVIASGVGAGADSAASGTTGCAKVFIVPPEIYQWINLNRSYLPEPPFAMEVTSYFTGMTSAGDRLDSNEILFDVTFTPDAIIPPTVGEGDGGVVAGGAEEGAVATDASTITEEGTDGGTDVAVDDGGEGSGL